MSTLFLSAEALAGIVAVAGLQIVQDLLDPPCARHKAGDKAVADRQKKEADHGVRVEKPHAALQAEEGLFPVMALGKQPVELRVDALEVGGVKLLAKRSLPVIPHGHRGVEAFGQVFTVEPGRRTVFQPDLRLIALPEDLVRGIRNQPASLRADRDILLLASFRQSPRGEGAEERVSGAEDLKEMRQQIFF